MFAPLPMSAAPALCGGDPSGHGDSSLSIEVGDVSAPSVWLHPGVIAVPRADGTHPPRICGFGDAEGDVFPLLLHERDNL